jgi:hypothetical protein
LLKSSLRAVGALVDLGVLVAAKLDFFAGITCSN